VGQLELLRALGHEIRIHILSILAHRDLSPAELARERGEPVSKVAYHFRMLDELGCAEVVRTRQVRGSVEHFYRRTGFSVYDDEAWSRVPAEVQDVVTGTAVETLLGRIAQAMRAGTFNARGDRHLTWTPVQLDEKGWREMVALLSATFDEVGEIEARAASRLDDNGRRALTATVAIAGFESPAE
jgi:DNA-binding transcriptional ArsR family regulator